MDKGTTKLKRTPKLKLTPKLKKCPFDHYCETAENGFPSRLCLYTGGIREKWLITRCSECYPNQTYYEKCPYHKGKHPICSRITTIGCPKRLAQIKKGFK